MTDLWQVEVEHVSARSEVEVPRKNRMAKEMTHVFIAIYIRKVPEGYNDSAHYNKRSSVDVFQAYCQNYRS